MQQTSNYEMPEGSSGQRDEEMGCTAREGGRMYKKPALKLKSAPLCEIPTTKISKRKNSEGQMTKVGMRSGRKGCQKLGNQGMEITGEHWNRCDKGEYDREIAGNCSV